MKIYTLCFMFCLLNSIVFGQYSFKVINQKTEEPIENAVVKIRDNTAMQVNTFFGDKEGQIQFSGDYLNAYFELSATGFETLKDTLKSSNLYIARLQSTIDLDPVVVTAQYQSTTASNSIQKITVISRQQIEQTGANNLADLLVYQSGIRLGNDNILGTSADIGGISGQNIKILIDGVPVIGRLDGNIDLSQLNLNNVERIEIVQGPLSVNYGTDALGGTINIITKKPTGKGVEWTINPYYETIGNYNLSSSLALRIKKQAFNFSVARNYFDGWSLDDPFIEFPAARLADTNRVRTWKPKEQISAEFRYQTELKGWEISPYFRHFNELIENRGMPQSPYLETAFDDYYYTKRADLGINLNKKFKKSRLTITAAQNQYLRIKNSYFKDLTSLEKKLIQTEGSQDTSNYAALNFRGNYQIQWGKNLEVEFGTDLKQESAYGVRISNKEQEIGDYAFFSTLEWKAGKKLIFKPGVRYGYNTVYEAPIIPSFNLKWQHKTFSIRASVAKGFRSPTLKELYFDFVDINHNIQGNTSLQAEYSWNYAAYLTWIKPVNKSILKFEYGVYYNDINNLITLGITDVNTYTYINIGTYSTIGNQAGITYRSKNISTNLTGTWIGRYNPLADGDYSLNPYFFSPELSANVTYSFCKNKFSLALFYKYNGAMQSFYSSSEGEIETRRQADYSILDLSLTSRWLDNKLNVVIGAKNLLNVTSVQIVGQSSGVHSSTGNLNAGRGISAFISLTYKLQHDFKKKP